LKVAPAYSLLESILAADYGVSGSRKQGLYEYVALAGEKVRALVVI
jgi:hypothetical protein